MKKPMEFYIHNATINLLNAENRNIADEHKDMFVHVIEKSAFDAVVEALKKSWCEQRIYYENGYEKSEHADDCARCETLKELGIDV